MNLKLKSADVRFILFILVILLLTFSKSFAVTKTSLATGTWATAGTWSPSGAPGVNDDVIIANGHTITIGATASCNSITFNTGSTNTSIIFSGTRTLTVTGAITFSGASGTGIIKTITMAGSSVTCGSIVMPNTTGTAITRISSTGGTLTVSGNITLSGDVVGENNITSTNTGQFLSVGGDFISPVSVNLGSGRLYLIGTSNQSICSFTQASGSRFYNNKTAGTATMTGNFTCGQYRFGAVGGTLDLGSGFTHTILGQVNFNTGGTLNCNSSILNMTSSTAYTGTPGTTGTLNTNTSIINYDGTIQTIIPITYNNLTLSTSGAKTFPTGTTTTVNGNLTLAGTATITFTGTLTYGASAGLIYNKTTHTKGNEWPSPFVGTAGVTIQSGTVTLTGATSVGSELNVNTGATLTTGGFLTLTSTASSTARLGTATGTITGDVTVERFIPGGADKRKWRFLSSPVNVSGSIAFSQLIDNILITAPAGSAAGFDVNPFSTTNTASLRTYNEATSGSSNNGWTDPTNITNTIITGKGMEVFVRGSRSLTDPYLNWTTPDDVTIDYVGALNTGTISPAITYTPSVGGATTADGFNLVGNPYASSIDFTNTGLTLTNVDDKFWSYNPNTGSYGIYDAGLNDSTNSITRYIASGQAFFIRANAASPVITFTEAIKVAATGNNHFKGNASQATHPILRIKISNDSLNADEALIVLDESASCNTGDVHDAGKLFNDALNIYTVSDDHSNLTINALPCIRNVDTIKVSVFSYNGSSIMTTPHHLEFSGMSSFPNSKYIYLKDEYTNTLTNLNSTSTYDFNITADAASWGNTRFKLLFANSTLGLNSAQLNNTIELFPNPASTEINLKFNTYTTDDLMTYQVVDVLGKIILEGTTDVQNQIAKINIESVTNGQYILRSTTNSTTSTIRFVK